MAEVPNIAQTIKDTGLVSAEVLVDGTELSNRYQIISINISHGINKIPAARLVIVDGEPNKADFSVNSGNDFKPGKKIGIKLGYRSELENVFSGFILSNSLRIRNDRPEMILEARDKSFRMTINKGNRYFSEKLDSEISEQLFQENGITELHIENSGFRQKQLVQPNTIDWDFMISRIDISGLFCTIANAQVTIRKPDLNGEAKLKLTFGDDILELKVEMDARTQNTLASASVWDSASQNMVTGESETVTIAGESNMLSEDLAQVAGKPFEMRTSVSLSQEEAKSIADTKKTRQVLSKIRGTVSYQGNNKITPGDFLQIDGVGSNFSGKHFISEVQHEYSEGDWITQATLGWQEQFFSEQISPAQSISATGHITGIDGLQIGIVTDIVDSGGEFRVKLRMPAINANDEGMFARISTLDAGNNRGTFFRPEIGDEVIVGFINNDPNQPVILGMLHSSAKSSPLKPDSANNQKGYFSRNGVKLLFDDGENSMKIETPGGMTFEMNDSGSTITIKDNTGNKILMETSGISIEAPVNLTLKAGATLSLGAPQLSFKADGIINVEGSGGLNMKSGGIAEIKGSLVKIN
jgi:Rhs element Vgr protein